MVTETIEILNELFANQKNLDDILIAAHGCLKAIIDSNESKRYHQIITNTSLIKAIFYHNLIKTQLTCSWLGFLSRFTDCYKHGDNMIIW